MTGPVFPIQSSYMVTNRAWPKDEWPFSIYPLPPNENLYFVAPGANNANPGQYDWVDPNPSTSMPTEFMQQLDTDIGNVVRNGAHHVTVLIHGLSYVFSSACSLLGFVGQNLAANGYRGLVIGYSWPSYDSASSTLYYASPYSFPPLFDAGTIRDNINGSTNSLLQMLLQVFGLCKKYGAQLNILCHSEGNYMLMLAMYTLANGSDASLSQLASGFIDQVLLVAADINNAALQVPNSNAPDAAQGSSIGSYAKAVTVYWTGADNMLWVSDTWTDYHNPTYWRRLGLHGPNSFDANVFLPNACGLDCSAVVNESNPYTPFDVTVHQSYFYIPQVLQDMAATLEDTPPSAVPHRKGSGNQYQMTLVPPPPTAPLRPLGKRLPKKAPAKA
jgi:esterase/lipase superfamily enzyme